MFLLMLLSYLLVWTGVTFFIVRRISVLKRRQMSRIGASVGVTENARFWASINSYNVKVCLLLSVGLVISVYVIITLQL